MNKVSAATRRGDLTPREAEFWKYIQENPKNTMPRVCADMHISQANYYYLKQQLKKKGYSVAGVVEFQIEEY